MTEITCMKCRGHMEDFSPSQGELWWICGGCGHAVLADPGVTMAQAMDSLAQMYATKVSRGPICLERALSDDEIRAFNDSLPCDVEG